jgi:hypothetical protein
MAKTPSKRERAQQAKERHPLSSPRTASISRQLLRRAQLTAAIAASLSIASLTIASAQAATKSAAPITASTPCGTVSLSQPFVPWGDAKYFWLAPGGDFEGPLAGWTLSGGATKAAGSEPFAATGTLGAASLLLPAGASVQTPFMCVDGADTYFRFFARNNSPSSTLTVSVVYTLAGIQTPFVVGIISGDSTWTPSPALHTAGKIASKLSGTGTAQMAIRFTASGGASQIDDVFVDPRLKH